MNSNWIKQRIPPYLFNQQTENQSVAKFTEIMEELCTSIRILNDVVQLGLWNRKIAFKLFEI